MARTIPEIIDALGVTALSKELGHDWPTTVQGWKDRQAVPAKHFPAVVAASLRMHKPTTSDELAAATALPFIPQPPKAKRRRAA
jgi:hypothetical protein